MVRDRVQGTLEPYRQHAARLHSGRHGNSDAQFGYALFLVGPRSSRRTYRAYGARDREEALLQHPIHRRLHFQHRLRRKSDHGKRCSQFSGRWSKLEKRDPKRHEEGGSLRNGPPHADLSRTAFRSERHRQRQASSSGLQGTNAVGIPGPAAPPGAAIDFIKPLTIETQKTSLEFFDILNFVLRYCPTDPSEGELMKRFAKIGVGADETFNASISRRND